MWKDKASTFAADVDFAFWFITLVNLFFLIGITLFIIYCCVKFSRKRHPVAKQHHGSVLLEAIWTIIPTILVCFMFYYGARSYFDMRNVPDDAIKIKVNAGKWYWKFTYPRNEALERRALKEAIADAKMAVEEEAKENKEKGTVKKDAVKALKNISEVAFEDLTALEQDNDQGLTVPVNTPIFHDLISDDVVHAYYVPSFRLKYDVMPKPKGEENWLWFEATKTSKEAGHPFKLFCAEYCGIDHARMISDVHVVEKDKYDEWYVGAFKAWITGVANNPGLQLYKSKGCFACHNKDSSKKIGPGFGGLYGKTETVITNGQERKVQVDDEYLIDSIKNPEADIVKGYPSGQMPVTPITDQEMKDLVEYIKSLK